MHTFLGFAERYKDIYTQTMAEMIVIDWEKDNCLLQKFQ